MTELSVGATGVDPPTELMAAARAVVSSLPWTSDTRRPFEHNLDRGDAIGLGTCTLLRPWAFGPHQGYFHIHCERGEGLQTSPVYATSCFSGHETS